MVNLHTFLVEIDALTYSLQRIPNKNCLLSVIYSEFNLIQ